MMACKVIGHVWATKKADTLEGLRFLMVQPLVVSGEEVKLGEEVLVAADPIGAGPGEYVLVALGRAARNVIGRGQGIGYQTAVVGIIDEVQLAAGVALHAE